MTKQEANDLIDAGGLTWGVLKTALRCDMGGPCRVSKVNPGMTHEQALTILAAAIDAYDDDGVVAGPKTQRPRGDRLMARNILRECSSQALAPLSGRGGLV